MRRANDIFYLVLCLWTIIGGTGRIIIQFQVGQRLDALPFISITLGTIGIITWLLQPILEQRQRNADVAVTRADLR